LGEGQKRSHNEKRKERKRNADTGKKERVAPPKLEIEEENYIGKEPFPKNPK